MELDVVYRYEFLSPLGNLIHTATDVVSCKGDEVFHALAFNIVRLSVAFYDTYRVWFTPFSRLRVYRYVGGVWFLVANTDWFLLAWERVRDDNDYMDLYLGNNYTILASRIVAFKAGSPQSSKNDTFENIIYGLIDDNYGSTAVDLFENSRDFSDWLTFDPYSQSSLLFQVSFSQKNILSALNRVVDAAFQNGVNLRYVVESPIRATGRFRFTLLSDSFGRSLPFTFSSSRGNIKEIKIRDDYREAWNVVYAGGGGQEAARIFAQGFFDYEPNNPFFRRELHASYTNVSLLPTLQTLADASIVANAPRLHLEVTPAPAPHSVWQYHWNLGDTVTVNDDGNLYRLPINVISFTYQNGVEDIKFVLSDILPVLSPQTTTVVDGADI